MGGARNACGFEPRQGCIGVCIFRASCAWVIACRGSRHLAAPALVLLRLSCEPSAAEVEDSIHDSEEIVDEEQDDDDDEEEEDDFDAYVQVQLAACQCPALLSTGTLHVIVGCCLVATLCAGPALQMDRVQTWETGRPLGRRTLLIYRDQRLPLSEADFDIYGRRIH